MPSVSKKQQKFMGIVRSIQKGEQPAGKFSKDAQKAAKKMKKSSVKKYAKTKHDDLPIKKESKTSNMMKAIRKGGTAGPWDIIISKNNKIVKRVSVKNLKEIPAEMDDVKKKFPNHKIGIESKYGKIVYREAKERDYKDEYKKFQSSTKSKKYRAELNKYNRQKGTYGNGDGKDASHKGGKIVGFESQSKNRGRAEKSRLKKEDIRQEIEEYVDGILDAIGEEFMVNEALRPSDKKVLMVIGRDIINLIKKKNPNLKPSKQLGQALNSIFRAMNFSKDNANYQQYKKYFPKQYNDKLLRRLAKTYMSEPFNVQNTFIKRVMDYGLKEGKYEVYFDVGSKGLMSKSVTARNPKEAEKKVASGLHGKYKIKKVVKEEVCLCEACQKGYKTHPTRKTKIMFGKRYRNCIKAEGNVNEESKVIKQISNLAKKNKYGTVDGTRMNAKTANLIMKIYNHPKMKNYKKKLDTYKSHELVDMTINMAKILKIKESIDEYSGFSGMSKHQQDLLAKQKGSPMKKSSPKVKKAQDAWSKKYLVKGGGMNIKKLKKDGHPPFPTDKNYNRLIKKFPFLKENWTVNIKLKEGTCGYGIDGKLGEEPAGPHLMKKKKKKKDEVSLGGKMAKKVGKHKGSRNILSKADGIKKVDKMKKTSGAKIYKVDKVKTRLGGELITMYNLYTKNTNHSSMSNPYGLEMMRKGNKAAYLIPVKESVNEKVKLKGKSGMGTISHVGMPKASKGVEKLFKIADTGFGKVGGQTVDSMSANLFKQIYNKANDDIKKKLNTKNEKQLIRILAGMWDKFGKNVKIGSSL